MLAVIITCTSLTASRPPKKVWLARLCRARLPMARHDCQRTYKSRLRGRESFALKGTMARHDCQRT
jgi:hypothetical protein